MNMDLEEQLKELGPDCRAVVARLRAARTVNPSHEPVASDRCTTFLRHPVWLVAASLLLVFGLSVLFQTIKRSNNQTKPIYGAREYHLSVHEIVATQRPDGGWQNDFLTRRNAEVLARCKDMDARIAYKKAMRNLRSKGIL